MSSASKRKSEFVKINTDVLASLLNLNVQFQKIFTPNTHSGPVLRIFKLKYQEEGALIEKKNLHVGCM